MDDNDLIFPERLGESERIHLSNVAANLQLVADLGYGDVALAVVAQDGALNVIADARPMTAAAAVAASRVGRALSPDDEPEAYAALAQATQVPGDRRRITRGISFVTVAYPLGPAGGEPYGVVVRNLSQQVLEAPAAMERAFMDAAEEILDVLGDEPIRDLRSGEPFSTERKAGDGVMRIDATGVVSYASPNAVNIMRLAGVEGAVRGLPASGLPGAAVGVMPVLGARGAVAAEVEFAGRVLSYRSIALPAGAFVLAEDVTETRRNEQELKVKEATIREVHHRVKNNLQTIASLLRIQARRAGSEAERRALAEATERVSSMAVVHELLAASTEERIDFTEAAHVVVDQVRRGLAGDNPGVGVTVEGSAGQVPAQVASSLALVLAELVHNAIEHGLADARSGNVFVEMRRLSAERTGSPEIVLTVRDDGRGLPEGFSSESSSNLGLAIVRTLVEDDMRGTLSFGGVRGALVTVRVPLPGQEE